MGGMYSCHRVQSTTDPFTLHVSTVQCQHTNALLILCIVRKHSPVSLELGGPSVLHVASIHMVCLLYNPLSIL